MRTKKRTLLAGALLAVFLTSRAVAQTCITLTGGALLTAGGAPVCGGAPTSLMMYSNGVINRTTWPSANDYSFGTGGGPFDNYTDTSHPQAGHTYDLSILTNFGGWQQATNWAVGPAFGFDISAYTKVQFDVYIPSGTNAQNLLFHYTRSGGDDIPICASLANIEDYLGTLTRGSWNTTQVVPLALLGALGQRAYYKWQLQQSNTGPILLDNVQFLRGNLAWMYNGGTAPFTGWTDASVNATANYSFSPSSLNAGVFFALNDTLTLGNAQSTVNVIKLTTSALHGAWKVTNTSFALAPYNHVTVGLLPTIAGYAYTLQFYNTSGVAVGTAVNPSSYVIEDPGVQGSPSRWAVYYIPLSAFGSLPANIGGFSIADASSQTSNVIYLTAPGFTS